MKFRDLTAIVGTLLILYAAYADWRYAGWHGCRDSDCIGCSMGYCIANLYPWGGWLWCNTAMQPTGRYNQETNPVAPACRYEKQTRRYHNAYPPLDVSCRCRTDPDRAGCSGLVAAFPPNSSGFVLHKRVAPVPPVQPGGRHAVAAVPLRERAKRVAAIS